MKNWLVGDNGKTRWSFNCEYPNAKFNIFDEMKFQLDSSKCGNHCLSIKRCTHFAWAAGVCWVKEMRNVPIVQTIDKNVRLCGFVPVSYLDITLTRCIIKPKGFDFKTQERQVAVKQKTKKTTVSLIRNSTPKPIMTAHPAVSTTKNQLPKVKFGLAN